MSRLVAARERALDVLFADGDWASVFVRLEDDEPALTEAVRMGLEPSDDFGERDVWEFEWVMEERGDVVLAAGHHFGIRRAQELFDSARLQQPVDVSAQLESHARIAAAMSAIASPMSFKECVNVLASIPEHDSARSWLWAELVRARPVGDVVLETELVARDRELVAREMRRLHEPASLLRELVREGHALEEVAHALLRVWPEHFVSQSDGAASVAGSMARMLSENGHPASELLEYLSDDHLDAVAFRAMRSWGLRATIAALALLERRGHRAIGISEVLVAAGYDDEAIVEALRTNGVGEYATVLALRDAGWSLDRLTDSLVARDASLMEIRDLLTSVGATRDVIQGLLGRHASIDRVRLVLG